MKGKSKKSSRREPKLDKYVIVGIVVIAVIAVGALIYLSGGFNSVSSTINFPTAGAENAPVVMEEYSDFQCHYCRLFNQETAPQIFKNYVDTGKVRYIAHYYTLGTEEATAAAEAAWCAADQNKFFEYQTALFADQKKFVRQDFLDYASKLRLEMTSFTQCIDIKTHHAGVMDSTRQAELMGISSTPLFFINGTMVKGALPYEDFAKTIDAELAKKK
jgi:protein-disulfide isomerase